MDATLPAAGAFGTCPVGPADWGDRRRKRRRGQRAGEGTGHPAGPSPDEFLVFLEGDTVRTLGVAGQRRGVPDADRVIVAGGRKIDVPEYQPLIERRPARSNQGDTCSEAAARPRAGRSGWPVLGVR